MATASAGSLYARAATTTIRSTTMAFARAQGEGLSRRSVLRLSVRSVGEVGEAMVLVRNEKAVVGGVWWGR